MAGEFPQREAIAAHQLGQLRQLLAAILPRNAFYQKTLAGLDPAVASLEDFSRRFPFTTKEELAADQRVRPPYGGNLTYALDKYTRFHQTSGTSSAPLRWLDTPESWSWMLENWKEVFGRRESARATGFILHFHSALLSGSGWPMRRLANCNACAFRAAAWAAGDGCAPFVKTRPRCFAALPVMRPGWPKWPPRKK